MSLRNSLPLWVVTVVFFAAPAGTAAQVASQPEKAARPKERLAPAGKLSADSPQAAQPAGDAAPAAAPSQKQYAQRRRRLAEIRRMSRAELERKLAETAVLDAYRGLPLLRERAFWRVAIDRVERDVDDLRSIPEVRRADELLRSPSMQARLSALLERPPQEMLEGLLAVLGEAGLTLDDFVLLSRVKAGEAKLAEYRARQSQVEAEMHELVQRAAGPGALVGMPSGRGLYHRIEEQKKLLRPPPPPAPKSPTGIGAAELKAVEDAVRSLIDEGPSP